MNSEEGEDRSWIDTVERELRSYREEYDTGVVTLDDLYEFSEERLARQYPRNKNIRAKIRQQLQSLRDQGKVAFLGDQGTYRIMMTGSERDLPGLSTDIFDLLDGTPENTKEANDRLKEVRDALRDVLQDHPKFEDFVWSGVGRKNDSPYTSQPHRQPGPEGEVEYRELCWLAVAHQDYRERYERPQDGVQLQFTVRTDTDTTRPPADVALHLDEGADEQLRDEVRSNLQAHRDEFLRRVRALDSFEVALGTESWASDRIDGEWDEFLDGLDDHFRIYSPLSEDDIEELGTHLIPEIANRFDDLLPLYGLVAGVGGTVPEADPDVWIEKTRVRNRPYKQEGEYALGKALLAPGTDPAGRRQWEEMREAAVGDIVLHLDQDKYAIVGVSVIDSELIDDFQNPPHDRWSEEQVASGAYLRWLNGYEEIEPPVRIYDDVLENPDHAETLEQIREEYDKIIYNKHLSLNQGHYFTHCPDALASIFAVESAHLGALLETRGYDPEPPNRPTEGYWEMVFAKREQIEKFLADPSKEIFVELVDADHFWGSMAYQHWPHELFEEHSPDEVASAIESARESGDLSPLLDLHQMGVSKATEILRAVESDTYAILNKRSRAGMEALGYEPPNGTPSVEEYRNFSAQVRHAHDEFDLRELMEREMDERIPAAATKLEVADWAFSENYEGRIELPPDDTPDRYADYNTRLSVDLDDIEISAGGLYFEDWDRIESRVSQALREGSHILLFGPPGTGKTKLAREICEAVVGPDQFELVTGSADWSTFDTIGGYQSTREQELRFEPGVILERFHADEEGTPANEWLVIDELNRADIDKAFGALFSALTGESVTLPFKHENGEDIEIVDASRRDATVRPNRYYMPADWRMISTMNTLDKTSLYEMSYAFMRRWAFIPVGTPDLPYPSEPGGSDELADLVHQYVQVWDDDPDLDHDQLATLGELWYTVNQERAIGPAIVEDMYRFIASAPSDPDYVSPIVMYVFPQLEGLRRGKLKSVVNGLESIVDDPEDLRATAEDFFQTDLSEESGE
ncbi:AAA family ATPase [Natrarchaeobius oligotrophus]|uniref:AAA family ATPase n=1 Tax=Natrarchaeobius chitinivorans TaxID=1679083 RepID=A0A3N6M1J4_NATCH|nr:AAA family ATPase [Natrarchaeobius chitinivorans]RQG95567.1 AAA family ATPase [Natrarchaeobius chitinivorans]